MKTLSIYLTLLTVFLIACQKDTDESPLSSEKKKNHCNKCPAVYLPINHSESNYSFTYKDSTGNLATIDSHNGMKLHFIYGNNNRIEKLQWIGNDGVLYDHYDLSYTGTKLTKLTENHYGGSVPGEVDNYTIRWDDDKIKNVIIQRVGDALPLDSIVFFYNSDNSIKYYQFFDPNQKTFRFSYSFSYKSGNYKYWAKDIKNKEIIFLAMIRSGPVIIPASNDLLDISKSVEDEFFVNHYSRTYHDQQYNQGNYPIILGRTYTETTIMEAYEEESQENITYVKVKGK
ncbi:hypothetical protein D3C78_1149950 [compost metagenome]